MILASGCRLDCFEDIKAFQIVLEELEGSFKVFLEDYKCMQDTNHVLTGHFSPLRFQADVICKSPERTIYLVLDFKVDALKPGQDIFPIQSTFLFTLTFFNFRNDGLVCTIV